jgi:hypothetical protein
VTNKLEVSKDPSSLLSCDGHVTAIIIAIEAYRPNPFAECYWLVNPEVGVARDG